MPTEANASVAMPEGHDNRHSGDSNDCCSASCSVGGSDVGSGSSGTAGCLSMAWPNRPDSGLVDNSNTTSMSPPSECKEIAKNVHASGGV